jgi:hypothetical protein
MKKKENSLIKNCIPHTKMKERDLRDRQDRRRLILARRMVTRTRAGAACEPCKARKAKCNDYRPCARCRLSRPELCMLENQDSRAPANAQALILPTEVCVPAFISFFQPSRFLSETVDGLWLLPSQPSSTNGLVRQVGERISLHTVCLSIWIALTTGIPGITAEPNPRLNANDLCNEDYLCLQVILRAILEPIRRKSFNRMPALIQISQIRTCLF